ncbi:uncharacterized protein HMPREF1541_08316 [Cyphellophora europaea CBS 101466]|uniref:DUF2406 domain-containing protein n=1 Tax=Cyphellophora europaea (strain CBS 101466) TaxID=1220924 RepID=W2RLY9_CYPE1|nr:uncharacterized protein HMPREF1541_08316 [Cyphellophora europaea CBS 101466]ETN37325.1 hypothetical protein HMPREF1541_08316 [Cyphellophora europaea CBS 101466]
MTTLSPPASPQPAQLHPQRPRAVSSMSHASTSSRKSKSSNKLEMLESPRDKKRFNAESKADPTAALNEATPGEIAQQHSNLDSLRRTQYKDQDGNVIADPDRSNPTRPRLERPLDTIRSFNAAAEGTASRRSSSYGNRPISQYGSPDAGHSRQGSYYSSPGFGPRNYNYNRPTPGGGYYRNNSNGYLNQQGASFDENAEYQYQDHYRPPPPRPGPGMRNMNGGSNPYYGNGHPTEQPMSVHSHQQSYETMTSGSDENGKSTNPSSLNSSYDQLHMMHPHLRKQDNYSQQYQSQYDNEMSFAPVSPVSPQLPQSSSFSNGNMTDSAGPGYYGNGHQNGGNYSSHQQQQPMPPPKDSQAGFARRPINLNSPPAAPSSGANGGSGSPNKGDSTKRQSWLSRKFSRKEK